MVGLMWIRIENSDGPFCEISGSTKSKELLHQKEFAAQKYCCGFDILIGNGHKC